MESGPGKPQGLQFDTAEHADAQAGAAARACASCKGPIGDTYYELNGRAVCERCQEQVKTLLARGYGGPKVLVRAAAVGLAAAIAGSIAWWGVRAATGYEVGLVAIGVGILVGIAVRKASGNRGGPAYQALAMFLTYNAAAMNWAPDIVKAIWHAGQERPAAASPAAASGNAPATDAAREPEKPARPSLGKFLFALVVLYGFILAIPFKLGSFLGLAIIGFGVYEAWKINRKPRLALTGPYRVAEPAASAGPALG